MGQARHLPIPPGARQRRSPYSIPDWQIPPQPDTAILVDLPGAEGVSAGIALARAGFRPVLVYNACPAGLGGSAPSTVDMTAIVVALSATASELAALSLSPKSPPAFLLDANRDGGGLGGPGWFDNRTFVSPSDFPSAEAFRRNGISKLLLVQPTDKIKVDLRQVLLPLQQNGLAITTQVPWRPWRPTAIVVKPPLFLLSAWEWLRRRSYHRGGALIPPSSG